MKVVKTKQIQTSEEEAQNIEDLIKERKERKEKK